jgi:hypothetical protein
MLTLFSYLLILGLVIYLYRKHKFSQKFLVKYNENTSILDERLQYLEKQEKAQHEAILYWTRESENHESQIQQLLSEINILRNR